MALNGRPLTPGARLDLAEQAVHELTSPENPGIRTGRGALLPERLYLGPSPRAPDQAAPFNGGRWCGSNL